MKVALITIFPEMLTALNYGMPGQAQKKGLLEVRAFNLRDFTTDPNRTIDDRPYGGGPGMVFMPEPLEKAILAAKAWLGEKTKVVYLSPQGKVFKQAVAQAMALTDALIFIAGRYEGIDERIVDLYVDEEWSIGDYVLSGGELPALVMIDAITRWIPGALGHELSNIEDSFTEGLLDCPHYTRPEEFRGQRVPAVLLSGNHADIAKWRKAQSLARTKARRPDLIAEPKQ
ncbi:MAG: trmD [Gammaproteobacteria bacterium]|jgi:tRNA (guanine37-N1)-methyltransferase|nr:trmD [Gammaproteobacteria bacterium]